MPVQTDVTDRPVERQTPLEGVSPFVQTDDRVDSRSIHYLEMAQKWDLIHDLRGGTLAMRAAREKWLPRQEKERPLSYDNRIKMSILFEGYKDTVRKISGRPFVESVTVRNQEMLSPELQEFVDDPDGTGRGLTEWSRDQFESAIDYGLTHCFVDMPSLPEGLTVGEFRRLGARPIAIPVSPPRLFNWQHQRSPFGSAPELSEIRIGEDSTEPVGRWGEVQKERIRVVNPETWELWERRRQATGGSEWFPVVEPTPHTYGGIPLSTVYFNRTGPLTADPPLEGLAWLNLAHWQSQSDQRNILAFSRLAILYGSGMTKSELEEQGLVIGADRIMAFSDPQARLRYAEHSGEAIEAGRNDLKDLEEGMRVLGMKPLVERSGGVTATAQAIDESREDSDMRAWINVFQRFVMETIQIAARWMDQQVPDDVAVDVFSDFSVGLRATDDLNYLRSLRSSGDLSRETLWAESKRRGVFAETFSVEREAELIEEEGGGLRPEMDTEDDDGDIAA